MTRHVVLATAAIVMSIVPAFAANTPSQTQVDAGAADICRPQVGGRLIPGRPPGGINLRGKHSNVDDEDDDGSSHRLPACPSPKSVK